MWSSPSRCTARTASGATGRGRVRFPRPHLVRSDWIHATPPGLPTRRPTTSFGGSPRRGGATRRAPAGKRRPSSSSSTARTPGSTSRARGVRSCVRSIGGSASHPALQTVTMARGVRGAERARCRRSSRVVDQRRLLHLDRPSPTTTGPGANWPTRGARSTPPPGVPAGSSLARAREELLIAEGSDWFWWYGDDHSSDHDLEFDDLFRRHVRNVYRALERADSRGALRHQHHHAAAVAPDSSRRRA